MEPMTVRELLAATDGKLLGDVSLDTTISGVETDSWAVHDGDLFVAIRGENIDGHQFITGALEGGALGCLTAVPPKEAVPEVLRSGGGHGAGLGPGGQGL